MLPRAVIMGSVCTVLGVTPMIAGVSCDFHQMAIAWQSESTLWWRTMSTTVAADLMVSTPLTLVVVPTVYALVENSKVRLAALLSQIKAWYLKPLEQRQPAAQNTPSRASALPRPSPHPEPRPPKSRPSITLTRPLPGTKDDPIPLVKTPP